VGVGRVERVLLAERVDVGVSSLANEATPGGRSGVGVGVRFEFVEAISPSLTRSASDAGVGSVMAGVPRGAR